VARTVTDPATGQAVAYGRPEVGPQVVVRMSEAMCADCDRAAAAAGLTRAEWLWRVIEGELDLETMRGRVSAAVARAEAEALRAHESGECHLSEWSCSHCEAAAERMGP